MRSALLSMLLLAALGALAAGAAEPRGMLWRIDRPGGGSAYLYGSVHFGDASMYPLGDAVDAAFAAADRLAVELDLFAVKPMRIGALMRRLGMYPAGDAGLRERLDPAVRERLDASAERLGVPRALLDRQRPWMALMSLTALAARRAGYSEQYGVDRYLLERAHASGKAIVELETMEQQLGVLAGLDEATQLRLLAQTLDDLDDGGQRYFDTLMQVWRDGDPDALDALINAPLGDNPALAPAYRQLLGERNDAMARKIDALLEQGATPFVVVGAGHLTGDAGLVALFERHGYTVTRL